MKNSDLEVSKKIQIIFQSSYQVEAKILNAVDFPPLKRTLESYIRSTNEFYGYFENHELAGIIEIERATKHIDINSLVVHPNFFRLGIGRKLVEFTFNQFDSILFIVETGAENTPATELYKKLGFQEIKEWNTDFGVRKIRFERRMNN